MKKNSMLTFNRISYLLFLLIGSLFIFTSCEKDEMSDRMRTDSGLPVIERVRTTDTTTRDSSLTRATLGSTVVIVGQNLYSAQTVSFNGYPITVNPAYATATSIIVSIPDSVPTVATNPNVPNELKVVNSVGEATYTFTVLPPRPEIEQISNEFAKPGETITLYGKYFYFVDTVFFGTTAVTTGIQANGTSLTVQIPNDVDLTQADIQVRSQSGISATGPKTKFYNPANTLMLINWDDVQKFGWGLNTGTNVRNDYPGITPISGKYAVIDQNVPGNWGWNNDKVINMNDWSDDNKLFVPLPVTFNPNDPIGNYELKMEIASLEPLGALMLGVWQPNPNFGTIEKNTPLTNFVKSADGKWYTVSVNLSELSGSGGKLVRYKDLYGADEKSELRVLFVNSTPADIPTRLAVDNIRIVKVR